jgi:hypothetical protein
LVRQWANLWQVEQLIWQKLVRRSGADQADFQVLDTLPVPVCGLKRYKQRHIFIDDVLIEPQVCYCASKDCIISGSKAVCELRPMV